MAQTYSPANYETYEFKQFSLTVTITDDTPPTVTTTTPPADPNAKPGDPPPESTTTTTYPPSYIITSVSLPESGVSVTCNSATANTRSQTGIMSDSFTVSGAFDDVFRKNITYLDLNNASHTVAAFKDLPSEFNAVVKYAAPSVMIKSVFVTGTTKYHGSFSYEIIVRYDFATANAALTANVAKGKK